MTKQREKNKRFESLNKYENTLNFKLLKTEKQYIMSNKELLSSRNRWHRNLTKDLYLEEGVKALEMLSLLDKNIILANNDKLLKWFRLRNQVLNPSIISLIIYPYHLFLFAYLFQSFLFS